MITVGRYSFLGITYVNIITIKYENNDTYYFIKPDVNSSGWWISSEAMEKAFKSYNMVYVGPYDPMQPIPYLKQFSFSIE